MREPLRVMLIRLLAVLLMAWPPAKSDAGTIYQQFARSTTPEASCCCTGSEAPAPRCPQEQRSCSSCFCCVPMTSAFVGPAPVEFDAEPAPERFIVDRGPFAPGRSLEPPSPIPIPV